MQHLQLVVLAVLIVVISTMSVGRVTNARLLPSLQNQTAWLYNQTSISSCLCNAMKYYSLSQVAAVNSFTSNATCQIILSPPVRAPKIVYDAASTLVLLSPLVDTPCCSNLAWTLERIKSAAGQWTASVTEPTTVSLNTIGRVVSTMNYQTRTLVRLNRQNLTVVNTHQLPVGYVCVTAIYRKGYIFFGCDTPAALVIFSESNLTTPVAQINLPYFVRSVSFARNDTLMFVAVQWGNFSLYIFNISWTPTISTSVVQKFAAIEPPAFSPNVVNDTYALFTSWSSGTPVYAITAWSATSNVWTRTALPGTQVKATEYPGEAIADSCGRIWLIISGFGIRIFDSSGSVALANWTLSTGLSNILLSDSYELFLTDYGQNKVYTYKPNLQCTS